MRLRSFSAAALSRFEVTTACHLAFMVDGAPEIKEVRRLVGHTPSFIWHLRAKGAPLRPCGRASLFVNLPGDEIARLIELVVDLGVK
jgi:hypothetical protein